MFVTESGKIISLHDWRSCFSLLKLHGIYSFICMLLLSTENAPFSFAIKRIRFVLLSFSKSLFFYRCAIIMLTVNEAWKKSQIITNFCHFIQTKRSEKLETKKKETRIAWKLLFWCMQCTYNNVCTKRSPLQRNSVELPTKCNDNNKHTKHSWKMFFYWNDNFYWKSKCHICRVFTYFFTASY